ncbi:MAG: hypothetical protein HWE26_13650 [Alteromonadaceae bacterium]|nr:hypothetical protein [Alteromonadaceae bacterium]
MPETFNEWRGVADPLEVGGNASEREVASLLVEPKAGSVSVEFEGAGGWVPFQVYTAAALDVLRLWELPRVRIVATGDAAFKLSRNVAGGV